MEDERIVALYWQRSEAAIAASEEKYGPYCHTIAHNILNSHEDAEECVSDTWLAGWNSMPPQRPTKLRGFFGKIARNLALTRWRSAHAAKRGGGAVELAMEELGEVLPAGGDPADEAELHELTAALEGFLRALPRRERGIFLGRYFELATSKDLADTWGMGENNVDLVLSRTRKKLRAHLRKEGLIP